MKINHFLLNTVTDIARDKIIFNVRFREHVIYIYEISS